MARVDDIRDELQRRRLLRELEARSGGQGAAPIAAAPAGAPSDVPAAPAAPPALDLGQGRTMADVQGMSDQFGRRGPVTIGREGLPASVNAVMRERGMGYNERADALIGKVVADIGAGVKQLTVGLDPQDEADVEAWRALSEGAGMDEGEGFINAGTVGDIAGNVAALALPMGAAEQGIIKGAQAVKALPRWASKMGAAATVGGAEGFARPVLEDDFLGRGANTAIGAALPTMLSGAVQAGRRATTGMFELSDVGKTLVDEGIQPTLGQGVETGGFRPFSTLAKNVEDNLEGILPGLAGGRERAEQEVVNALAKRAVPPGSPASTFTPGSPEYFREVDTIFDAAYKDVLDGMEGRIDTMQIATAVTEAIENLGMMVNPSTKRSMAKVLYGLLEPHAAAGMNGANARAFQSKIRTQLSKFSSVENANENTLGGVEILSAIDNKLSDIFEKKLGAEGAAQLKAIDEAYSNKMLIETASGFRRVGEHIPVDNLDKAVRARTGRTRRLRGGGQGQDITDPAFRAMGAPKAARWVRALSGVGATVAAGVAPMAALPALGATAAGSRKAGAKALFGLYAPQRQMKRAMDEIVEPKIGTATALISDTEE